MRILHVLDHSLPLHSGYTFRTVAILREQRALGWETLQLTTPRHGDVHRSDVDDADGWHFHRTPLRPERAVAACPGSIYVAGDGRDRAAASRARRQLSTRRPARAFAGAERAAGAVGRHASSASRSSTRCAHCGRTPRSTTARRAKAACATARRARSRRSRCAAPITSRRSATACAARSSRAASPRDRITVIPNAVDADAVPVRRRAGRRAARAASGSTARRCSASPARSTPTKASTC